MRPLCIGLPLRCRRLAAAIAVVGQVVLAACGDNAAPRRGKRKSHLGSPVLNPVTVHDLLASITNAGLAAPNPLHVTHHDCPGIGCMIEVDSDTVSIIKFRGDF